MTSKDPSRITRERTVVAFDLDNTLLYLGAGTYERTVRTFLTQHDVGLGEQQSFIAYEVLRARGDALARLGLHNPLHYRGHPEVLAAFCLAHCTSHSLLKTLQIFPESQPRRRRTIERLSELHKRTNTGTEEDRLQAEQHLRKFSSKDIDAQELRAEVRRVAELPLLQEWADTYAQIEQATEPAIDVRGALEALTSEDRRLVVISHGFAQVQTEKLTQRGIAELFFKGILVTETAAEIPGAGALAARIDDAFEALAGASPDAELRRLWYYHCLIDLWASKTPWFYARCLHALQSDLENPERALRVLDLVGPERWRARPLRFVMIGDRYDTDVRPLLDLLGPAAGFKVRLRQGKYANQHPEDKVIRAERPDRTCTDWNALSGFLRHELGTEHVPPIASPPDIFPRGEVDKDLLAWGRASELEAIRHVAAAAVRMGEWGDP